MVAEDATTMEEAQAAVSAESVKASAAKEEVLAVAVSEAVAREAAVSDQEVQPREKADLAEEAKPEVHQHLSVKADFHRNAHQEDLTHQDHLMRQEKEGQEKANSYC